MSVLTGLLPYVIIAVWLLISGFGLPLPEDIPLILAGASCSPHINDALHRYFGVTHFHPTSLYVMLPLTMVCIFGADSTLWMMGRRYGHHIPRIPILRRYLTPERLAYAETKFHGHTGKTLFVTRFLPGLRTPIFFSAGVFKVPYWKMVVFDGSAALISVPTLVMLGYFFANQIERVEKWSKNATWLIVGAVVLLVVGMLTFKLLRRKRNKQSPPPPPAEGLTASKPSDQIKV